MRTGLHTKTMTEYRRQLREVEAFAAEWKRTQGYEPAAFQKAIAMQRLARGESIPFIIDALVAQRV